MKDDEWAKFQRLGQRIDELIKQKGYKRAEVASRIPVNRATLHHWIHGDRRIDIDDLLKLFKALPLTKQEEMELLELRGYPVYIHETAAQEKSTSEELTQREIEYLQLLNQYREGTLDFVAVVRKERVTSQTHSDFDQRSLSLSVESPQQQIEDYRNVARNLADLIDELDTRFKHLDHGALRKILFDVQQGGLFFRYIREDVFVFAATTDQVAVDNGAAYREVEDLAQQLKKLMRLA